MMQLLVGISTVLVTMANPSDCNRESTYEGNVTQDNGQQQSSSEESEKETDSSDESSCQLSFKNCDIDEKNLKQQFAATENTSGSSKFNTKRSNEYGLTGPIKPFKTYENIEKYDQNIAGSEWSPHYDSYQTLNQSDDYSHQRYHEKHSNVSYDCVRSRTILPQMANTTLYGHATLSSNSLSMDARACAPPKRILTLTKPSHNKGIDDNHEKQTKDTSMDDFIKQLAKSQIELKNQTPLKFFDAVVVYDKKDYSKVNHFMKVVSSLIKVVLREDLKIELFDSEEFCQSIIMVAEDVINKSSVILIYLTNNTTSECLQLFCDEVIGMSRLGLNNPDVHIHSKRNERQWVLKPVHTLPLNERTYKVPIGLVTVNGIDWYDKDSEHTKNRIVSVMQEAIRQRKLREEHDWSLKYASAFGQKEKSQRNTNFQLDITGEMLNGGSHVMHPSVTSVDMASASLLPNKHTHHTSSHDVPYVNHQQKSSDTSSTSNGQTACHKKLSSTPSTLIWQTASRSQLSNTCSSVTGQTTCWPQFSNTHSAVTEQTTCQPQFSNTHSTLTGQIACQQQLSNMPTTATGQTACHPQLSNTHSTLTGQMACQQQLSNMPTTLTGQTACHPQLSNTHSTLTGQTACQQQLSNMPTTLTVQTACHPQLSNTHSTLTGQTACQQQLSNMPTTLTGQTACHPQLSNTHSTLTGQTACQQQLSNMPTTLTVQTACHPQLSNTHSTLTGQTACQQHLSNMPTTLTGQTACHPQLSNTHSTLTGQTACQQQLSNMPTTLTVQTACHPQLSNTHSTLTRQTACQQHLSNMPTTLTGQTACHPQLSNTHSTLTGQTACHLQLSNTHSTLTGQMACQQQSSNMPTTLTGQTACQQQLSNMPTTLTVQTACHPQLSNTHSTLTGQTACQQQLSSVPSSLCEQTANQVPVISHLAGLPVLNSQDLQAAGYIRNDHRNGITEWYNPMNANNYTSLSSESLFSDSRVEKNDQQQFLLQVHNPIQNERNKTFNQCTYSQTTMLQLQNLLPSIYQLATVNPIYEQPNGYHISQAQIPLQSHHVSGHLPTYLEQLSPFSQHEGISMPDSHQQFEPLSRDMYPSQISNQDLARSHQNIPYIRNLRRNYLLQRELHFQTPYNNDRNASYDSFMRNDARPSSQLSVVSKVTGKLIINPNLSSDDLEIDAAFGDADVTVGQQTITMIAPQSKKSNILSHTSSGKSDFDLPTDLNRKGKNDPIVVNIVGLKNIQLGSNNMVQNKSSPHLSSPHLKSREMENNKSMLVAESCDQKVNLKRNQIQRNILRNISKELDEELPGDNNGKCKSLQCNLDVSANSSKLLDGKKETNLFAEDINFGMSQTPSSAISKNMHMHLENVECTQNKYKVQKREDFICDMYHSKPTNSDFMNSIQKQVEHPQNNSNGQVEENSKLVKVGRDISGFGSFILPLRKNYLSLNENAVVNNDDID